MVAPQGCLVNAVPPVPVGARNITGNILHAVVFGCLAQAVPQQVQADCGSACWSVVLSGEYKGREVVEYFFLNGGYGARPGKDGVNVLSYPTNVANVPIEVLEQDLPLLFSEKALVPDSGGMGQFRGGLGQRVRFTWRGEGPINLSLLTEKTCTVPVGTGKRSVSWQKFAESFARSSLLATTYSTTNSGPSTWRSLCSAVSSSVWYSPS